MFRGLFLSRYGKFDRRTHSETDSYYYITAPSPERAEVMHMYPCREWSSASRGWRLQTLRAGNLALRGSRSVSKQDLGVFCGKTKNTRENWAFHETMRVPRSPGGRQGGTREIARMVGIPEAPDESSLGE